MNSMKNSDEAIEKVLAGLRNVEAPVGMERRVLDGLEKRAARRSEMSSGWFGPVWRGVPGAYAACAVGVAGVAVVMLMVPVVRRFGHAPVQAHIGVGSVNSVRHISPTEPAKDGENSLQSSRVRLKAGDARVAGPVGAINSVTDSDAIALSETRAASFPAPPMPLTDQERLLLRLSQKNDSVELAMLDPRLRELEEAQEKTEFQRFFARPVLKEALGQSADAATAVPTDETDRLKTDSGIDQGAPQVSESEKVTPAQTVTPPTMETPK
ncbi:MAG TPA: hypothetical protein VNU92_16860 [Edaphobacter sp.]|jgi:hypothetical protein|nr:hypothetical protein [Edaphobacter sp.]